LDPSHPFNERRMSGTPRAGAPAQARDEMFAKTDLDFSTTLPPLRNGSAKPNDAVLPNSPNVRT
jgi:hypothetical protein